jgi:hypothetical protein
LEGKSFSILNGFSRMKRPWIKGKDIHNSSIGQRK